MMRNPYELWNRINDLQLSLKTNAENSDVAHKDVDNDVARKGKVIFTQETFTHG